MLWIMTALLFVVWAVGIATDYTGSGRIHFLPIVAIAAVLLRLIEGQPRRSMKSDLAKTKKLPGHALNGKIKLISDGFGTTQLH
jgi:hypothetical protein